MPTCYQRSHLVQLLKKSSKCWERHTRIRVLASIATSGSYPMGERLLSVRLILVRRLSELKSDVVRTPRVSVMTRLPSSRLAPNYSLKRTAAGRFGLDCLL